MVRLRRITNGEFLDIKDHWNAQDEDSGAFLYTKDMNGLKEIIEHCKLKHGISAIAPPQEERLLRRLVKIGTKKKIKAA